jgi:hypothetical protein
MFKRMSGALGNLSAMVKMYFPSDLKTVLLEMALKIDALERKVDLLTQEKQK